MLGVRVGLRLGERIGLGLGVRVRGRGRISFFSKSVNICRRT